MMPPTLSAIRNCLEGIVPSVLATADADGTPNVSMISHVQYVDPEHVALSYQFFNKTRRNLLATKRASVAVVDPETNAQYRLALDYVETQTSGPLFEAMRAKLAGIASHSGMQGVFRLLGSDVFRVREIESIPSVTMPQPVGCNLLSGARRVCDQIAACDELGDLFDAVLAGMQQHFGIEHAMVLMLDATTDRLYTVASRGYPVSGIGSEVGLGEGVIGVAARQGVPIRIGRMASEYSYGTAVLGSARAAGLDWPGDTAIPYPGLPAPQSQIAMPILRCGKTIGVLFAESPEPNQFGYDEEDALSLVTGQLSALIALLQEEEVPEATGTPPASGAVTGREDPRPPLCRRQHGLHRPRLSHQGRCRRDPLEARQGTCRRRPRRVHQPRIAPRSIAAPSRICREPGGPPRPAAAPPLRARRRHSHGQVRPRPLPPRRRRIIGAGGPVGAAARSRPQKPRCRRSGGSG